MKSKIAVLDYDIGNVRSVVKALEHAGAEVLLTSDGKAIKDACGLVVPGVSAFGACIEKLEEKGLFDFLVDYLKSGRKYLGICLGYQILFEESEESPGYRGLSYLKGKVRKFTKGVKVPHIGWNEVEKKDESKMFSEVGGKYFYFVHSYYVEPQDEEIVSGWTEYGDTFASAIEHENIWACQFHPEKSSGNGIALLKSFVRWCSRE